MIKKIQSLLGAEADDLLNHKCTGFSKESLHLPGPDFIDRVWMMSDRPPGGLALPGVAVRPRPPGRHRLSLHPAGGPGHGAFRRRLLCPQPHLLRPGEHRQAGHRRAAATRWPPPWGCWARWPGNTPTRSPSSSRSTTTRCSPTPTFTTRPCLPAVEQAFDLGAVAVGATIYFGSPECRRQILEISEAFKLAHELGMATHPLVLPAQPGLQDQGGGLPRLRRPHRPGQLPGGDHRGGHHQAEAGGEQRRL